MEREGERGELTGGGGGSGSGKTGSWGSAREGEGSRRGVIGAGKRERGEGRGGRRGARLVPPNLRTEKKENDDELCFSFCHQGRCHYSQARKRKALCLPLPTIWEMGGGEEK